jgi:hypothetical protein
VPHPHRKIDGNRAGGAQERYRCIGNGETGIHSQVRDAPMKKEGDDSSFPLFFFMPEMTLSPSVQERH